MSNGIESNLNKLDFILSSYYGIIIILQMQFRNIIYYQAMFIIISHI